MRKCLIVLFLVISSTTFYSPTIVNALSCSANRFSVDVVDGVSAPINLGCYPLSENGYSDAMIVFNQEKSEIEGQSVGIKPNVTLSITYSGDNPYTTDIENGYSRIIAVDRGMAFSQPYYTDIDGTMYIYKDKFLLSSSLYTYMNARNPVFYYSTEKIVSLTDKSLENLNINSFSVHISVNGADGYSKLSELQIVPGVYDDKNIYFAYDYYNLYPSSGTSNWSTRSIKPQQTYYKVEDVPNVVNIGGTYSKPIHQITQVVTLALSSTANYALGIAPDWLPVGTYYSKDGISFYYDSNFQNPVFYSGTTNIGKFYNYYSYLNLRSKTLYSANDLQNYYNYYLSVNPNPSLPSSSLDQHMQILVDSQNMYGVNALYILAMAGQESTFGRYIKAQNAANFVPYTGQIVINPSTNLPENYTVATFCTYNPTKSFYVMEVDQATPRQYNCADSAKPDGNTIVINLETLLPQNVSVIDYCSIHTSLYDKYVDESGIIHYCNGLNNLFGIGVYDDGSSDGHAFSTVQACVDYLAGSLLRSYFSYTNSKFYATNIGNKGASINTKYASDPWWSSGITRYAYYFDRYLGFKDFNNQYMIGIVNDSVLSSRKVYKDKQLTTLLYEMPSRTSNYPFLILEGLYVNGTLVYKIQTTNPVNPDGTINTSTSASNIQYDFERSIGYISATQVGDYLSSIVTGVSDGGIYNADKEILFNSGTVILNGIEISSGTIVSDEGIYSIVATNSSGLQQNFTFTIDKTSPVISINPYQQTPTNQDITVTATTNEGHLDVDSHTFTQNGNFVFTATDEAGNVTQSTVDITNIDKIPPVITIGTYDGVTVSANDLTITATTDEGTLNVSQHVFMRNGSFDFIATDAAGNVSTTTVTITNIVKPVILTYSPELIGGALSASLNDIQISSGSTVYSTDQILFNVTLNSKYQVYKWFYNDEFLLTRATTLNLEYPYLDTTVSVEFYLQGDFNDDGKMSTTDLVQLRRIIAGLDTGNEKAVLAADINGDGKVSTTDLVKIRRMLAGLE